MPSSQLKRLKASLREQGIVGPQKSKKQKKQAARADGANGKRTKRSAALEGIREQFNPFEVKSSSRGPKYEFANAGLRTTVVRPGVTKRLGEETRRKTLLVEMQRRHKVGGMLDKRFGENDPTMTPEERALERFVKEKQGASKRSSMFDLEDDEDAAAGLTHLGQSLAFSNDMAGDDFDDENFKYSENSDADNEGTGRSNKRRKLSSDEEQGERGDVHDVDGPERAKTKQEVMKEVIAKSKLHKYERQKAKEDDDELRAELDLGLADIYTLMRGAKNQPAGPSLEGTRTAEPPIHPDRAVMFHGKDRADVDREYDERFRQMAFDARSRPTTRTKTDEEKAAEEASRLKELEEKRLRRMRGEDDDSEAAHDEPSLLLNGDDEAQLDDRDPLGLGHGIPVQAPKRVLDVEDEDEFVLDDDLVASDTDASLSDAEESSEASQTSATISDDEKEFVQGLLTAEDAGREDLHELDTWTGTIAQDGLKDHNVSQVAFTYPCPQTHEEFLKILSGITSNDLITVIQRIRALHHPKLNSENKTKLGVFAAVLVDHASYLSNQPIHPSFALLEQMIRHIHSLAKSYPVEVGNAFRTHLAAIHKERPTELTPGDLVLLTAIGTIFSVSDHFHQVATPAMLSIARYLGQKVPQSAGDLAKSTYLGTLCLHYQHLSKRYVPELVNQTLHALAVLSPTKPARPFGSSLVHASPIELRVDHSGLAPSAQVRKMRFWDMAFNAEANVGAFEEVKIALLETNIMLAEAMAELWVGKSAYYEIMEPFSAALTHLCDKACSSKLPPSTNSKIETALGKISRLLQLARLSRRPLALHAHRPLAIKTSNPKFEESYHPSAHYDPDRDRAATSKLRAEYKRERKGALRELRKDANFIAREGLREKKERDALYEKKYKRLVAEIQGEEGREANAYEREKTARKSARR